MLEHGHVTNECAGDRVLDVFFFLFFFFLFFFFAMFLSPHYYRSYQKRPYLLEQQFV